MNVLFHLGHPAHFHLFKNVIEKLNSEGNTTNIIIKKKDILEDLLIASNIEYHNILPLGRKETKFSMAYSTIQKDYRLLKFCLNKRPDIMIGTSSTIAHVGKLLGIPSLVVNEDDADVVPLFAKMAYPLATKILSPDVCKNGKWEFKSIKYNSYHELAYLHPDLFVPKSEIVCKYIDMNRPYVLMRFASLGAHHDEGIKGINDELAFKIIDIIEPHANIYITSERKFDNKLEKYRLKINPIDIHHVMAHAFMYIGDSQTMAAESGVLGVPFIRYNDFVGRIGYLANLEDHFKLGFGIKTNEVQRLMDTVKELVGQENLKETYQKKRLKMLDQKINLTDFMYDLIINYKKL